MEKEEIKKLVEEQNENKKEMVSRFFMGTTAYHFLGDISRDKEDLFVAGAQTDDYFIGNWVTGFGFINVCFPKTTSRELTDKEVEEYENQWIQVGSQPPYKLDIQRNKRAKLRENTDKNA